MFGVVHPFALIAKSLTAYKNCSTTPNNTQKYAAGCDDGRSVDLLANNVASVYIGLHSLNQQNIQALLVAKHLHRFCCWFEWLERS